MPALPLLLLLAVASTAAGDAAAPPAVEPRSFAVADGSTLSYRLFSAFHEVVGSSKAVEGRARWLPDGTVQVMVRARVDSFDSGNSNRDAHMKEVTEAARLPYVTLKAVAEGLRVERYPADLALPLRGVLQFHGVERPSLLFVKVGDRIDISARLSLTIEPAGAAAPPSP